MKHTIFLNMIAAFSFIFTTTAFSQQSHKVKSSGFNFEKESLATIREIDLHDKDIETFPMEIFQMKNLQTLDLSCNSLDALPGEIKNLENLRVLKLNGNNIYELPQEISRLKLLKEIYLDRFIWCYRLDELRQITDARIILAD